MKLQSFHQKSIFNNSHFKPFQSISNHSKAIKLSPELGTFYLARGYAYWQNKKYPLAMKDMNTTLKLEPDNPYAYYTRGLILKSLGSSIGATHEFEIACRLKSMGACIEIKKLSTLFKDK